jgi:hypothetical protein
MAEVKLFLPSSMHLFSDFSLKLCAETSMLDCLTCHKGTSVHRQLLEAMLQQEAADRTCLFLPSC